ncbi:thioredoxin domain-containing protein [Alphaproteobacteria bacterium]|nr:thioredoxin domain-containing protein [Alphaproteobacteria bacterium]
MTNQFNQNRLADATSPYLQQHKDNPVHWQPWEAAVFDEARRRNVPVLLSVGYAACHWCHVMAHESFEDEGVAALMNAHYVCIKLDREERPDLDDIYMTALSMMGQQGGWPLTMFLDAEARPFWGGTYFPKLPQYGRPGFMQILQELSRLYTQEPERIAKNAQTLADGLTTRARADARGDMPADLPTRAAQSLLLHIDLELGGLSGAPKFPQPFLYQFLGQQAQLHGDAALSEAVRISVSKMCAGGLYDHVGGGFARYSVDAQWLVPHFEKMLYDNALMLQLMCWVYSQRPDPVLARRISDTVTWLKDEMQLEGGAFAASLDADTEGEEGLFYVWSKSEIDDLLGDQASAFLAAYNVTQDGNFEGRNIPNRLHVADDFESEVELDAARAILLKARNQRVRPGRDDKVLADWNAMAIIGLSDAAALFDRADWAALAVTAFDGMRQALSTPEGGLVHSARNGRQLDLSLASDLALGASAACKLAERTGDMTYLATAEGWMAILEAGYKDPERGGYFANQADTPGLLVRNRPAQDNASPSANAAALDALAQLAGLTGKPAYRQRAQNLFIALSGMLAKQYPSMTSFLLAKMNLDHGVSIVLIAGQAGDQGEQDADFVALRRAAIEHPILGKQVYTVHPGQELPLDHPAHAKTALNGAATAYICPGLTCLEPVQTADALRAALDGLIQQRQASLSSL